MKFFRSITDVETAHLIPPLDALVKRLHEQLQSAYLGMGYEYNPNDDGFIALVEESDGENAVAAMYGYTLLTAVYEDVRFEDGCFVAFALHNNQFGITWIIPDAPWLNKQLRERLVQECAVHEVLP